MMKFLSTCQCIMLAAGGVAYLAGAPLPWPWYVIAWPILSLVFVAVVFWGLFGVFVAVVFSGLFGAVMRAISQ